MESAGVLGIASKERLMRGKSPRCQSLKALAPGEKRTSLQSPSKRRRRKLRPRIIALLPMDRNSPTDRFRERVSASTTRTPANGRRRVAC